jgi:hypothetical protein
MTGNSKSKLQSPDNREGVTQAQATASPICTDLKFSQLLADVWMPVTVMRQISFSRNKREFRVRMPS